MRQVDYILEEAGLVKGAIKKIKKFFTPLTPEEREEAGVKPSTSPERYKKSGKQVPSLKKKFKTDETGTVRSKDRYGVQESNDPSDKLPGIQARISGITKQLNAMRVNWDRNSSVLRKDRKALSTERDSLVSRAKEIARRRESEQRQASTGKEKD